MVGSLYATIGYTCVLVCIILYRCNKELFSTKIDKGIVYISLLGGYTLFAVIDGTWGLLDSKIINFGISGFYVFSFLFHLFATLAALSWLIFIGVFFNSKPKLIVKIIESIPFCAAVYLLIMQFVNGAIYSIDDSLVYHSGPYRKFLFYIQILYLVIALVKGLVLLFKNRHESIWEHKWIVVEFMLIPIAAGFLQMMFPDEPYYSVGIILTAVVVFNGIIVIDKTRESEKYELISKETYKALEALCGNFISVHLFDLKLNRQTQVKSSVFIDILANKADNARDQIISVMEGISLPKHREEMVKFVDIYTLNERMRNKNTISAQFEGKVSGWCISRFSVVERDEEGNLTKVIHAVQDIDESKRKEIEFTQAIKRAYENKNAIYAELVKMQAVGMIATDESDKLIIANDVAASMFGYEGKNVEGMSFEEFWRGTDTEASDSSVEQYNDLVKRGGQFSCELKILAKGDEESDRYLYADVKRVDLLDGSKVIVSCFTDITKRKMLEKKLRNLSDIDGLTGICNRRSGERSVQELLHEKTPGLFCMLDINDFKHINDSFGHKTGDDALVEVANSIKKSFRSDDVIMRLGGDEFAIFAKNVTSFGLAKSKIERLFDNVEGISIENMHGEMISISLGAVLIDEGEEIDYVRLYSQADGAMYSCKGKPGNNMSIVSI